METRFRSIAKALSWRFIATAITFSVAWMLTGEIETAVSIGLVDTTIKLAAYYWHERTWIHIKLGKMTRPEYEI